MLPCLAGVGLGPDVRHPGSDSSQHGQHAGLHVRADGDHGVVELADAQLPQHSSSEQSAWTTWVSWSAQSLTSRASCSIAEHLDAVLDEGRATAVPNRPRPTTSTDPVEFLLASRQWDAPRAAVVVVLGSAGPARRQRVIVPTRPTNMSPIRVSFADAGSPAVMPVDRPTVANAEIASNRDDVGGQVGGEQQSHGAGRDDRDPSRATVSAWRIVAGRSGGARWWCRVLRAPRSR